MQKKQKNDEGWDGNDFLKGQNNKMQKLEIVYKILMICFHMSITPELTMKCK